jgi:hypothetical protein
MSWGLLPDAVVVVFRVADGSPCWSGPVWPQRGQAPTTLSLPQGSAQCAPTGAKLRLALADSDEALCIVAARSCIIERCIVGSSEGGDDDLSSSVLRQLQRRLLGCIVPLGGLKWGFSGSMYLLSPVPQEPRRPLPGGAAPATFSYYCIDEDTLLQPSFQPWEESTDEAAASVVRPVLGGLEPQLDHLCQIITQALLNPQQYADYGLTPTR